MVRTPVKLKKDAEAKPKRTAVKAAAKAATPSVPPPAAEGLDPTNAKRLLKIQRTTARLERVRAKYEKSKDEVKRTKYLKQISKYESRIARAQAKLTKAKHKVERKAVKQERKATRTAVKNLARASGPGLSEIRTCAYELCRKEFRPDFESRHHCTDLCAILASYKRENRRVPQQVLNRVWKKLPDHLRPALVAAGYTYTGKGAEDESEEGGEGEE